MSRLSVIPAKAGIRPLSRLRGAPTSLDSRFRGNDGAGVVA
jgi:hypothetical protein